MANKQYIAPGVYSELEDASEFSPAGIQPQIAAVQPIFAKRGEDGRIKLKEDVLKAIEEYGMPSYSKFRDFNYYAAMNWLKGGLPAHLCRLTASDAVKAQVLIGMRLNPTLAPEALSASTTVFYEVGKSYLQGAIRINNGEWFIATEDILALEEKYINSTGKWKQIFKYSQSDKYLIGDYVFVEKATYIEVFKATTASAVPAGAFVALNWATQTKLYNADYYVETVFHDGSLTDVVNIGKFEAIGSGADYNGIFLRFGLNDSLSNDLEKPAYKFEVVDYNDKGEAFVLPGEENDFSFAEIKDLDGNSIYIQDTIAEVSKTVRFVDLLDDIKTGTELSAYEDIMDVMKGRHIALGEVDFKQVFLSNVITNILNKKIILSGGNDGSLIVDGKVDAAVRDQLLVNFYTGLVDDRLLSFMEIPSSFTFDMQGSNLNLSYEISNFTKNLRTDVFSYHSGAKLVNAEALYNYRIKEFNFDNRNAALRAGWFRIRDPYELKIIEVPVFLTKITDLARSVRENGVAIVHAGYGEEGVITNYIPDSLTFAPSQYYQDKFNIKKHDLAA